MVLFNLIINIDKKNSSDSERSCCLDTCKYQLCESI